MICPNCGNDNKTGNKFCVKCGTKFQVTDEPIITNNKGTHADNVKNQREDHTSKTAPKKAVLVCIVLGILVIVGGIVIGMDQYGYTKLTKNSEKVDVFTVDSYSMSDDEDFYVAYFRQDTVDMCSNNEELNTVVEKWDSARDEYWDETVFDSAFDLYVNEGRCADDNMDDYNLDMDVLYYAERTLMINDCSAAGLDYKLRNDDAVMAMGDYVYLSLCGAVHDGYSAAFVNFDAETGDKLSLQDICYDYEELMDYLSFKISVELEDRAESLYDLSESEVKTLLSKGDIQWFFSTDGIVLFADIGVLTSYADGFFHIEVPYSELEDFVLEEYMP